MCYKFDEVNFYENSLNVKEISEKINLQSSDEALNICDLSSVIRKFSLWQRYMPCVKPFYAVKCNDDPFVVKTLVELGAGFDCASKNEIKQILEYDVPPERIIFANPCKPVSHLTYAKERNIKTHTVDNEFEIYKILKHYPESQLVIRFRSEAKEAQCPLGDKFGCDIDSDAASLMLLAMSLQLNITGTSFHVGSGCSDLPAYDKAIVASKKLFQFGKLLGANGKWLLDIGGGFPGSDDEKFIKISEIINKSIEKNFCGNNIEIIAEPGRFFVASAYTLICKIHSKREIRKSGKLYTKMYYLNDGVYGSFNCIIYDHQEIAAYHLSNAANEEGVPTFKTLVWGPTCDALDKITDNVYLPNLSCGEFIVFPNMGAYTIPIASPFNGFLQPKTLYFQKTATS